MYDFYLNSINPQNLINDKISDFEYSDNLDDFASSFSFSYLPKDIDKPLGITSTFSDNKDYINRIIVVKRATNEVAYIGIITDEIHTTNKYVYDYIGYDVGFYLNKNEVIKQFKNKNVGDAITELCKDFGIDVKNLPQFQASVSKIFKDEIFSDIVKELLKLEKDKGGFCCSY